MEQSFLRRFGALSVLALLGVTAFVLLYDDVAPRASVDLRYSRNEIMQRAETFMESRGYDVRGLQQDAWFSFDGDMHLYLQKYGLREANAMLRADTLPTHHWYVSWYNRRLTRGQNPDFYEVWISPGGRILGFNHIIKDTVGRESLSEEEARLRAESVLKENGADLSRYSLKTSSTNKLAHRNDHFFVWTTRDTSVDNKIWARVQGDEVGGFRFTLQSAGEFRERLADGSTTGTFLVTSSFAASFLLFFFIVILFLRKYHEGEVGTKTALLVFLGLYIVSMMAVVNEFSALGSSWMIGDLNKFNIRFVQLGFQFFIIQLFFSVMTFAAWSVGESSSRSQWPRKLAAMDSALLRRFFTLDYADSVMNGYLWGLILLGAYSSIFSLVTSVGGVRVFSLTEAASLESSFFPIIQPMLQAFSSAVFAEIVFRLFFISFLKEKTGKQWIGVVVSTAVWTFCAFSLYGVPFGYLGFAYSFVTLAVLGLFFSFLFLKYDVLTVIVANVVLVSMAGLVPFFSSSGAYFRSTLWVGVVFLAVPLLLAIGGFIRRNKFEFTPETIPPHIRRITERERMAKELEIARRVQMSLLPKSSPSALGFDIAGTCIPAMEVGGDYYDFVNLGGKSIGIAVGDVSGKGVPAAIYMTLTKGILQSHAEDNVSPKRVLSKVNSLMYRTIDRNSFVSMFYAILDIEQKRIRFARAGQCPVILAQRHNEEGAFLTPKGMALGLEIGKVFDSVLEEQEVDLHSGEVLVFYTDGFTEAMNDRSDEFGELRLVESISRYRSKAANEIISGICRDVDAFTRGFPQHDDMTMVVVKVH